MAAKIGVEILQPPQVMLVPLTSRSDSTLPVFVTVTILFTPPVLVFGARDPYGMVEVTSIARKVTTSIPAAGVLLVADPVSAPESVAVAAALQILVAHGAPA
jgi:hypothetical protein